MAYPLKFSMRSLKAILLTTLIGLLFVTVGCGEPAVGRAVGVDSPESSTQLVPPAPLSQVPDPSIPMISSGPTAMAPPVVQPTKVPPPVVQPTKVPPPVVQPTKVPPPVAQPDKVLPTVEPIQVPETESDDPNSFNEYGFNVSLDEDADLEGSDLSVTGLLSEYADFSQGLMSFNYNGADIALSWLPQDDLDSADLVDLGYSLLVDSQPENEFMPLTDGDIEVDGEMGSFGGLFVTDSAGTEAGGGLIGGWICEDQNIGFMLMVTSPDSTVLQIRFDRIVSGFECP
ncbi:MAG: hypothetical protein EGP12_06575 [SAR202 cluster bacterium]|nr:MAG: hypothetical protein EGP12_06575 [SAR202 cluster bacterium]